MMEGGQLQHPLSTSAKNSAVNKVRVVPGPRKVRGSGKTDTNNPLLEWLSAAKKYKGRGRAQLRDPI